MMTPDQREAWRPALIAFYRREACPQSAENLQNGWPLGIADIQLIDALQVAFEKAPEPMRIAA